MPFWSRLAHTILDHPRPIIGVIVGLTLFLGYWTTRVQTDHTAGNFLSEESDVIRDFRRASEVFGESQTMLYVVFPDVEIDSPTFLTALDTLTRRFEGYDGVETVLSLTNVPILERQGNELRPRPLFESSDSASAQAIREQPFLRGLLVSEDLAATVMLVNIGDAFNNTPERIVLVERIMAEVRAVHPESALAGFPYLRSHYARRVSAEAPLFTLLALLISLTLLFVTFRSWQAVVLPAIVVAMGMIWTIGLVAMFGHRLNIVIAVLPALLIIIGMANAIHITTKYFDKFDLLDDRRAALVETIRTVGLATFLTCLTTAIGFFVLNLSGSHLLEVFGTFAAIGIMMLYALSITLLPLAYVRMRPPTHRVAALATHDFFSAAFDRLALFAERRSWPIMTGTLVVIAIGIGGITRISSDIQVFSDFSPEDPLRVDLATFEDRFGGVLPLELIIESDAEGSFRNPALLRRIERLQADLKEMDAVGRALSASDLLKLANQAYFGGHPANYRLPSNYEMPFIESALTSLLEGGGGGLIDNLPPLVDSTFSVARIYMGVDDIGTERINTLADSIVARAETLLPPDRFRTFVTGTAITSTRSGEHLVGNLIVSLGVALLVIALLMALLFRSARLTLISLIPNVIPLLLVGATMGYAGITLKPSTALIFSLAFGIAVDDTIHFLAKYRILKHDGLSKAAAIRITLAETGKAILFTSLVLMGGFLIFTMSSFAGTASMGALTALTLFIALLTNLIVLPALLYRFGPEHG
jgi:uncharacterized protein